MSMALLRVEGSGAMPTALRSSFYTFFDGKYTDCAGWVAWDWWRMPSVVAFAVVDSDRGRPSMPRTFQGRNHGCLDCRGVEDGRFGRRASQPAFRDCFGAFGGAAVGKHSCCLQRLGRDPGGLSVLCQ